MIQVELPDGRVIDVDADTPEQAAQAARLFLQREKADNIVRSAPRRPSAFGAGLAQGLTGGFADEIFAGIEAPFRMLGGAITGSDEGKSLAERAADAYNAALAVHRASDAAAAEESPAAMTAGDIAGGVMSMGKIAKAVPILGGASGSLARRAAVGGATGAGIGGVEGFARGEGGAGERLGNAGYGAAGGALAGIVAPAVTDAVGSIGRGIGNLMGARAPGMSRRATGEITRALNEDMLDDQTLRQRLGELGEDAMLADVSPNLRATADVAGNMPGEGRRIVGEAIRERQAQAGERVNRALNRVLGRSVDTVPIADDIIKSRAAAAAPAYKAAYEAGDRAIWTPGLERLSGSPAMQKAMKEAVKGWQDRSIADGFGAMNPKARGASGVVKFQNGGPPVSPNLQFWDYTKRAVDDMAKAADRAGETQRAATLRSLAAQLRRELDAAVPEYAAARDAYAGPSAILDALEEGQKVFSRSMTPGQLRKMLDGMSAGERDAFRQGARAALAGIMGTARNDARAARSLFAQGWTRDKIEAIVGPQGADILDRAIARENTFQDTANALARGSPTQPRAELARRLGGARTADDQGFFRSLLNFRWGDAGMRALQAFLRSGSEESYQKLRAELAKAITARGPERDQLVTALIRAQQSGQLGGRVGQMVGELLALTGLAAAPVAVAQ